MSHLTLTSRTPARASVAILAALALTLTGCSSEEADAPDSTPVITEDGPAPATAAPATSAPDEEEPTEEPAPDAGGDEGGDMSAIEDYVKRELDTVPALMEQTDGLYSDVSITAVGPEAIEYAYTYAEPIDEGEAVAYFDGMVDTFQSATEAGVFPVMEQMGVPGPQKAIYTYLNPDGSEIWSHEFVAP